MVCVVELRVERKLWLITKLATFLSATESLHSDQTFPLGKVGLARLTLRLGFVNFTAQSAGISKEQQLDSMDLCFACGANSVPKASPAWLFMLRNFVHCTTASSYYA